MRLVSSLTAAALLLGAASADAQLKLPRISPDATAKQTIGLTDLTVTYSRPGVKGRTIWGDLVPYDKPWRTGANEATTFTATNDVQFGGQKLAAGTYSLFTIPGKDEWTVVLNSEKDLWGAFEYKPEKDVLRVKVKPEPAPAQEWMSFTFEDLSPGEAQSLPGAANLVLRWEKLRVAVPVSVDVSAQALAACRTAVAAAKADDWRTPYQAAGFCLNAGAGLDEGRQWLQKSLGLQQNYYNVNLLARWQAKDGKKSDAIASAKKALDLAKQSKDKIDTAATEKLLAEWTGAK